MSLLIEIITFNVNVNYYIITLLQRINIIFQIQIGRRLGCDRQYRMQYYLTICKYYILFIYISPCPSIHIHTILYSF